MKLQNFNTKIDQSCPIIQLDNDQISLEISKRYYQMSGILNPFETFSNIDHFLEYIKDLAQRYDIESTSSPKSLVLLLDLKMPIFDGFDILTLINNLNLPIKVHTVMFTGFQCVESLQKALELGATGYIIKPYKSQDYKRVFDYLKDQIN